MKVSAVLLSWARQYHIPLICENLRKFPEVAEVIVVQNEHEPTPEVLAAADRVIHFSENQFTLGRFLGAKTASENAVLFQDDDCLIHHVPKLCEAYEREGGERIVCTLADDGKTNHWGWWQRNKPKYNLLGWGSIMPKRFAFALDDWPFDKYLLQRKADAIITASRSCTSLRGTRDDLTRLTHQGKESGRDSHALWQRSDHQVMTQRAIEHTSRWLEMTPRSACFGVDGPPQGVE